MIDEGRIILFRRHAWKGILQNSSISQYPMSGIRYRYIWREIRNYMGKNMNYESEGRIIYWAGYFLVGGNWILFSRCYQKG
ncbi:MAG: hypothetical protein A2161_18280 [Candidatus Schekmanbacteria bacterium RBG_13_48_7]|uniref:Uncharacterized protein n=1 Tax=Candidatus Schekmanbacteria bacterium RBG_13_48_7 TaxID=1817878 RepID=A0A1F7RYH1_9BACT|nr:MAG: hypothetical protein A2161_18280 [Candidatus Schekmanbacteria bacterium RBG_13_48_7]